MLFINIIWSKKEEVQYKIWLYILPVIAIVSEILQIFISEIGTFDIIDLLSYVSAILTFNIFTQWNVNFVIDVINVLRTISRGVNDDW